MIFQTMKESAPQNERVCLYKPGTEDRDKLEQELTRQLSLVVDIPLIIGGKEIRTGVTQEICCPHDHKHVLGKCHLARQQDVVSAIENAGRISMEWASVSWQDRAAVFRKAAEILANDYRYLLNGATMLGQSKTIAQAEIDSACELIDFWRFNPYFMEQIQQIQPFHSPGIRNQAQYRPLEGFILAITPFNFTAIGGNLPTAPAMMGNVVIWKPARTAALSAYYIMEILKKAGLPDGVINFVPGSGRIVGDTCIDHPDFAGVHFTGSTRVFNSIWKRVGDNLHKGVYRSYPRLVGETGGKDFVIAAPDADIESLTEALFRGAYEYQGQKCSAASRAYIPSSIWPQVKEGLYSKIQAVKVGDITNRKTFMGAVIDEASYLNIKEYVEDADRDESCRIIAGGQMSDRDGWFVDPVLIETTRPDSRTMVEEIFGPVLTVYVYDDNALDETLKLVDQTSPYGLTGSIFATDRQLIHKMQDALENSAGNFYINDKPTGAVVGQQPFGGSRASGTNDKAGSILNLLRWTSMRVIKEKL